ncbi:MAG: PIN domain-containing protein [Rickettsiales bacterium]|nr:PIN domain-containing protein [Rickettsiales bacterium]
MIYLDTNVLINSILDGNKKKLCEKIFLDAIKNKKLFSSYPLVQETCYVLAKNKIENITIEDLSNLLIELSEDINLQEIYYRALNLSRKVGFTNINDCIHTAIAEAECEELITYDKGFKKIIPHTNLKITILD